MALRFLRVGIGLVAIAVGFFLFSWGVQQQGFGPFGTPTDQVFVPTGSPAAQRGYAFPGEGTAAFFMASRPEAGHLLIYAGIVTMGLALLFILLGYKGLPLRSAAGYLAGKVFQAGCFGLFLGGVVAIFLIFLPLEILSVVIPLVVLISLIAIGIISRKDKYWQ